MTTRDPHSESERLRAYYAQLPEEELARIGSQYQSLTDSAKTAIRVEFDRRSLPAPELADDNDLEFQALVTLRYYRDLPEAQVAKSALESAGIFAFLRDENTVRIDWGYSNAVGGIRLQVRPEDASAAEEALSQPIPSTIESGSIDYEQPRCPFCQSLDINFEAVNSKVGHATMILGVPIPWPKAQWICRSCGREWKEQPNAESNPQP